MVRGVVNHQHVVVEFPVREKAGEALVGHGQRTGLQGLRSRGRQDRLKRRFQGEAFVLLRRRERSDDGAARDDSPA